MRYAVIALVALVCVIVADAALETLLHTATL